MGGFAVVGDQQATQKRTASLSIADKLPSDGEFKGIYRSGPPVRLRQIRFVVS